MAALDKARGAQEAASQAYDTARSTVSQAGQKVARAAEGAVQGASEVARAKAGAAAEAGKRAAEAARAKAGAAAEAGKRVLGMVGNEMEEEEEGPPPPHDEVDATPEEQMFRHKVEWEPHREPGPLQRAKEATVHAAEGVVHRIEGVAEKLHLTQPHTLPTVQGQPGQPGQQQAGGSSELRMAKTAEGRDARGAEEAEEEGPPPPHDEVDASPEEQFVRHHIKWPEQGPASAGETHPHPGPLQRLKETAVHAAEKLPLIGHHHHAQPTSQQSTAGAQHAQRSQVSQPPKTGADLPGPNATAEERTGEPLHMAKAAEGRNETQDDPVVHAVHAALRPEPAERAEGVVNAFPETLEDAIKAAQINGVGGDSTPATGAGGGSSEEINANPFSSGARSKL